MLACVLSWNLSVLTSDHSMIVLTRWDTKLFLVLVETNCPTLISVSVNLQVGKVSPLFSKL